MLNRHIVSSHKQYRSATTPQAAPLSAQGPPKTVGSVTCFSPGHNCTLTYSTIHMGKFADDTTLVGLITKNDETHNRRRLVSWPHGVETTTLCRISARPKRLSFTFGEVGPNTHHWASIVLLWREWAAPHSLWCTSVRTPPGPPTLDHW